MKKTTKDPLRKQAEKALSSKTEKGREKADGRSQDELIHELQVHQIELEMQNDELKRTQASLEEISAKYFDFFQSASLGYFIVDKEWIILEANLTGTRMLGTTQQQVAKKPLHVFIKPEFQDTFHLYRRKLQRSEYPETCELMLKNNMYVSMESIAVLDEQGKKTGKIRSVFTCITELKIIEAAFVKKLESQVEERTRELLDLNKDLSKEIAERKRVEEEIKQRTADLESANAELEGFSYTISHDLRSPLRAIEGFTQMLLNDIGDKLDPESIRKFNVISGSAKKMSQLIDDLLSFSRTGRAPISRGKIDMKVLVEDIWKELQAGNPDRDIELKINGLPLAAGDRMMMRQVVSNLLGNAVKFTRGRKNAIIEISGSNSGGFNTYCFKDNGAGFDMLYYDKLFEIFSRLHSRKDYEGTGVGLAIVKKIIERHGGKIWAESKPGAGSIFCFTLPEGV